MRDIGSIISIYSQIIRSIHHIRLNKMGKLFWLYFLLGVLSIGLLSGCNQQQTSKPIIITFTPVGTNEIQLERIAENQEWNVVVHWTRNRTNLPGFTDSYRPKSGNYFLVAYITFVRNPAFEKGDGVIKLSYQVGSNNYTIHESGIGNNEVFGDFRLSSLVEPNPNDPHDRPFSTEVYFEVPKDAQNFQLSFGSTSPISLGK